jgi:integrase
MARQKTYIGRIHLGHGKYHWVGRFPTRKARDAAVARARVELESARNVETLTVEQYAQRFLARYERTHKHSSYETAVARLKRLRADLGDRPLRSITRLEARDWIERNPWNVGPLAVQLFNAAVDDELLERNPFRGTPTMALGRRELAPPTEEEFGQLLEACSAHGWYAPQMRALLRFAAYSGMRPGELYALEWADVDFQAMRVRVGRRLYNGRIDTPKSNRGRTIALTPPARDALLGLDRTGLVFRGKRGNRLCQPTLSQYWGKVLARARLDFDFYLATKHWCVHYLYAELGLPPRAIAEQMGWSLRSTIKMVETYAHANIGALEQIDKAFATRPVQLRAVNSDATETQGGPEWAS